MTTKDPSLGLRALLGVDVPLPIGDVTIMVRPMGWSKSVDAIDAIMPALDSMPITPGQKAAELSTAATGAWVAWLHVHRDDVVLFCHLATDQDKDVIAGLPVSAMLELVFGILDINADFFVKNLPGLAGRVGDRVNGLVARIAAAFPALQTTSSASSSTGTPSAT